MSIASRLSLGMSDKDKEWIEKIIPMKNLQPRSPGFDSGISGVSLDSDHQNTEQRLDGEMDFFYKNPFFVESEELAFGTEKKDDNVMDNNNSFHLSLDILVESPPESDPFNFSDLSNSSNLFYGDAASDDLVDMSKNTDQPIHTASLSPSFDCDGGKSSISNKKNQDFCTATSITKSQRFNNNDNKASTSTASTTNNFVFSRNNTNKRKENTPKSIPLSDGRNNLKDNQGEDTMDDKQKLRLLRNRKNAEMAKASRQKKKNHLQNLEEKVKELTECNIKLRKENELLLSNMDHKNRENDYLKNILANNSAISQVLDYVPVKKKIHLSSEFCPDVQWSRFSNQNCNQNDEYTKNNINNHPDAGICLHIKPNNHISLEFCVNCSQSSRMGFNQNQEQLYQDEEFSNP